MLINMIRSGNVNIFSVIVYIISSLMVIFLVMPLHEWAHGFVAYKLGDNTAKYQGRLTLNPLAHIDYMGAAMILLIGFGWAKPVPVDSRYFKKPKRDMALTALAGPVSNLLAAIVAGLLMNLFVLIIVQIKPEYRTLLDHGSVLIFISYLINYGNQFAFMGYVLLFFRYLMVINISLAVFNFIPIPPLDGSKILMAFLPNKWIYMIGQYQAYISMGFFILVMMGAVGNIISPVQEALSYCIGWLTALPFGLA